MITRCNCTNQCMLWLVIKNVLGIIPLIFYLTMLIPLKGVLLVIYNYLWSILIIYIYIYLILWLTPVLSRILVMVYFSINSISYQYMLMLDLPCGKNINNDTGILSGEVLQWYNYLCACRLLSFIYIYTFFLVT